MTLIGKYRIIPLPDADLEQLERKLMSVDLPPTRVTRSLSSNLAKTTHGQLVSYEWSAVVDSMNDSYNFPDLPSLQNQLDGMAVVTELEQFESVSARFPVV